MRLLSTSPARACLLSLSTILAMRCAFAAASTEFHIDGDITVSLLQGNDWLATPQRAYFWGQDYMGTTEVWLFSSAWRLLFGARSTIPLIYWVFVGQAIVALGAALVYAGLVQTDASFWSRTRVFVVYLLVFGFTAPALQKYSFGLGHGYSALPFYAGLTIAAYLFRDRFRAPLFLLIGLLLGQSHYIFRLHLVYPLALVAALLVVGPRVNLWKSAALVAGVVLGMLPERLFLPAQGYDPKFCFADLQHVAANAWQAFSQSSVHVGTLPYGLLESEHALWFIGPRPISADWIWWGERAGATLLVILLAIAVVRSWRSPEYLIFPAILAVNLAVLAVSCLSLDIYTGRRYMYLSVFSIPFLIIHPPWTIWHRLAIGLRTAALVVYVVAAVSFRTPLATFAERSGPVQFDQRYDCLIGSGSHLSALMALNDLSASTVDLDWRLRSNYSRNVEPTPEAIRDRCRQLFWIDANGRTAATVRALCEPQPAFYTARPTGIASYPQQVTFARCRVPR